STSRFVLGGDNYLNAGVFNVADDTVINQFTVAGGVADTTPPTVSITAPSAGATVSGTVAVTASATDNVGVASVQFQVNGSNLGSPITAPPYTISWDTTTAANGTNSLTAVALDIAGNSATSAPVSVTVSNVVETQPPVISAVSAN